MPEELLSLLYLAALLISGGSLLLVDWRFEVFLFREPLRAGAVLVLGLVFFLAWDLAGISLGIFLHGPGPYMTGIMLAPELPLEELFFLLFLCHLSMVLILGAQRLMSGGVRR
ncbi:MULTISPECIES: lycopene cyclase domain-containing protein [Nesterenkonia]|uniref:Lycopene cyclase domain-containing protein n=1 Tax=Nesterenkonia xinjiangensis TaxID=225327 RepID=A0A7Z0KBG7_9MICC|nr:MULTISPECIES: lycopene cyclase domain-containing protein [Nesterenkonia]MDZ5078888.1 lycopene cyclase domain-containing protein [Nesterenkonia sp. HG001]NYJ77587.1 lycopene cyclase domain-containing protein [Nesterenkonia xinjiangensis]